MAPPAPDTPPRSGRPESDVERAVPAASEAVAARDADLRHALRNDLTAMLGLAYLLADEEGLSDDAREWARMIVEAGQRMNERLDAERARADGAPVT